MYPASMHMRTILECMILVVVVSQDNDGSEHSDTSCTSLYLQLHIFPIHLLTETTPTRILMVRVGRRRQQALYGEASPVEAVTKQKTGRVSIDIVSYP
jgi:hypothetical protein